MTSITSSQVISREPSMPSLLVQSRHMLADLAVVDPDLTVSVPPQVTAATGMDAMARATRAARPIR